MTWTRRRFMDRAARGSAAALAASLLPARSEVGLAKMRPGSAPSPSGPQGPPSHTQADTLRARAATRGSLYGSAVDVGLLRSDPAYRALLAAQCSILVAENAMKWQAVHPAPEVYRFDQADALVDFAEANGIKVRGHNLCWHEALPGWFQATVTPANAAQLLTSHIRTVAGRYKGRLRAWDVVNEAIWIPDGRADGLRDSPWLRLLGPGYLELAFRIAKEADPHAILTYNEYGIEYDTPESEAKRHAVLKLLRGLKARGVPVEAVGIQSHLDASTANLGAGILAFVAQARGLGLQVFVTEMDVNDDCIAADDPAARDAAVARVYAEYVTAMVTHGVTDVLTWGISDSHSWLSTSKWHQARHPGREVRGLPFDDAYQPTPAFYALRGALGLTTA